MKKCSHCGGSNLRKTNVPFDAEGFTILAYVNNKAIHFSLDVFICMDCAHIEWFAEDSDLIPGWYGASYNLEQFANLSPHNSVCGYFRLVFCIKW